MRRMLLVANPNAHGVTPYAREVIAGALTSAFKLEELQTLYPGHAVQVARDAAQDGVDVVAVLGGDGTVNEVVNGIAGSPTALALIPGGLGNCWRTRRRNRGGSPWGASTVATSRRTAGWGSTQPSSRRSSAVSAPSGGAATGSSCGPGSAGSSAATTVARPVSTSPGATGVSTGATDCYSPWC